MGESFLARDALRNRHRAHHVADPLRHTFQIDFDFIRHQVTIQSNDGGMGSLPLQPQSVAAFYRRLMQEMDRLDLHVDIHKKPHEVADVIPFDHDESHAAYDPEYANRFWRILMQADRVCISFGVLPIRR